MVKAVGGRVPGVLPPTGVDDPATRKSLQQLVDAHNARNGNTQERFVTARELDGKAVEIVARGLNGVLTSRRPGQPAPGGGAEGPNSVGEAISALEQIIRQDPLFIRLGQQIVLLSQEASMSIARIRELGEGFIAERTERIEQDRATVSTIETLKASVDSSVAAIINEQSVQSSALEAIASQQTTLVAAVNGNAAAVAEESEARSTADGNLAAHWSIRVQTGNVVSGVGLMSSTNPNGTTESRFYIRSNRFAIAPPSGAGANDADVPFIVEGGVVYIKKAMIKDADIDTAKIAGGSVTSMHYDAELTDPDDDPGVAPIGSNVICNFNITVPAGSTGVALQGFMVVKEQSGATVVGSNLLRMTPGVGPGFKVLGGAYLTLNEGTWKTLAYSGFDDNIPAGTHSYQLTLVCESAATLYACASMLATGGKR